MREDNLSELLRLVSEPFRLQHLDKGFDYEVTVVKGFNNETLLVDISDYEPTNKEGTVLRLKDVHDHNKYR